VLVDLESVAVEREFVLLTRDVVDNRFLYGYRAVQERLGPAGAELKHE